MTDEKLRALALVAGGGAYPRILAESARQRGVERLDVIAFRGETEKSIERVADLTTWIEIGRLGDMIDALGRSGAKRVIMAGRITPTHLFRAMLRMDRKMKDLLNGLVLRNAETIFGGIARIVESLGIEILPASTFMESHMPAAGLLSERAPTVQEQQDVDLGLKAARITSALNIGQTVVVKHGTILAVEAFEGTNAAIKRAADLAGTGIVVVKTAKRGHDMRFDIPVVGLETMELLRRTGAAVLAVEAGRTIVLEQDKIVGKANAMGLCLTVLAPATDAGFPTGGDANG
jgi:DUF1009 family protein